MSHCLAQGFPQVPGFWSSGRQLSGVLEGCREPPGSRLRPGAPGGGAGGGARWGGHLSEAAGFPQSEGRCDPEGGGSRGRYLVIAVLCHLKLQKEERSRELWLRSALPSVQSMWQNIPGGGREIPCFGTAWVV